MDRIWLVVPGLFILCLPLFLGAVVQVHHESYEVGLNSSSADPDTDHFEVVEYEGLSPEGQEAARRAIERDRVRLAEYTVGLLGTDLVTVASTPDGFAFGDVTWADTLTASAFLRRGQSHYSIGYAHSETDLTWQLVADHLFVVVVPSVVVGLTLLYVGLGPDYR